MKLTKEEIEKIKATPPYKPGHLNLEANWYLLPEPTRNALCDMALASLDRPTPSAEEAKLAAGKMAAEVLKDYAAGFVIPDSAGEALKACRESGLLKDDK